MNGIRACQMLFVGYIGLFAVIVAINNITDYPSNFRLTQKVMGMDTTFPNNKLRWRAVSAPGAHHAVYWLIIALEAAFRFYMPIAVVFVILLHPA